MVIILFLATKVNFLKKVFTCKNGGYKYMQNTILWVRGNARRRNDKARLCSTHEE